MKRVLIMCAFGLVLFGCNGGSSSTAPPTEAPTTNDILPAPLRRSYAEGAGGGVATSSSYRMNFSLGGPPTGELASSPSTHLNPTE
jgi:hypothetical protein